MKKEEIYIILDNVKYNNNTGAIFRVADGINATKTYVCKQGKTRITNHQEQILKKISRGASNLINWELCQDSVELVKQLKCEGISIISVDVKAEKLIFNNNIKIKPPVAVVFGSEWDGVNPEILDLSDEILKIPMYGQGNSLNVGSAVAIVMYKIKELILNSNKNNITNI